jgi:glycosyltransferase involved in cell wall biosynthesis
MTSERQFTVVATSGAFAPGFLAGGPIRALTQLVDTLPADVSLHLVTSDRDFGARMPYPGLAGAWHARGGSQVFYLNTRRVGQWRRLFSDIRSRSYEYLYVNSLWSPVFSLTFVALFLLRLLPARRLLIAPRGELSPGALSLKAPKKRLLLLILRRVLNRRDIMWHATSAMEADEIRAVFSEAAVLVSADRTDLSAEPLPPTESTDEVRLVFLSRISPKKNLEMAVRALAAVTSAVALDVFGPIEDADYWASCQAAARELPANVTFRYCGTVAADEVQETFRRYDAFLFPTLGENFGYVIPESLSSSCPVLCSDRTPWTPLLEEGGGRVFRDMSIDALRQMLRDFCALDVAGRETARAQAGAAYRRYREAEDEAHLFDAVRRLDAVPPR